jgi:hypothetical protein
LYPQAISALSYTPMGEVLDYYKALVEEELPCVLEDVKQQLEVEEDDPVERFADIQKSIERFLDYVEATYIGKVLKSGLKIEIRTEN